MVGGLAKPLRLALLLLLSGHPLTGKATYIDYPLTVCTHIRTFTKNMIVQGHINIMKLDILLWTSGLLIQTSLNPFSSVKYC